MKTFLLLFCVFNNQTQNHINNNYTPDNNYNNNYTPTTITTTTIIFYNNMNIIIIVIPLISCYLLRFTHAVTSLLPRCDPWPHKQSSLVTLLPSLLCPCSSPPFPCIVAAIYVHFCGFSSPSSRSIFICVFIFAFYFAFYATSLPSPCLPATSAPPAPLLASSCFVYASRFRFCFAFFCFFFLLLPISAWINSVFKSASFHWLLPSLLPPLVATFHLQFVEVASDPCG